MSNTLTAQYPFAGMSVGSSFTVHARFQHARVAASEYARRNGWCFTCRSQGDGSMIVYRIDPSQRPIDSRGARGKRSIPVTVVEPTAIQFNQWLATFAVGQSYTMPSQYGHMFTAMVAWCELYGLKHGRSIIATARGGELLITRHS